VIDNEIISYAKRYMRGVDVQEETLAVELVRSVGIGGSFLDTLHTAEHFRREFFMPQVLFRERRAVWEAQGKERMNDRAEMIAEGIINREVDNGLTAEQATELDAITKRFIESRTA